MVQFIKDRMRVIDPEDEKILEEPEALLTIFAAVTLKCQGDVG